MTAVYSKNTFKVISSCILFISCFITNESFSQNDATFRAYLLSPPSGRNCNGIIRFEFHTCECLNNYGIDITINGDGSWCGVGNTCSFNHCDGTGFVDKSFPPGEYDIVGTVNSGAACSNPGKVFKRHVSIPNPACDPGYITYNVVQPIGYQCLGKIENIFFNSSNCIAYNYINIYLVDANGSEYYIDHPNMFGSSVAGLGPGTYSLKVTVNNECSLEQGGIVINAPPCPVLSLKYDPIEKVGFNCIAHLNNYTVTTDKQPCLTLNYYDMLIYDENKNLIFGPDHPDHPINVNLLSGHKYYLESKLFFGQCTSGLQPLKIGPNECKGNLKATKIIPESGPGCKDGSIELRFNSDDCFSNWYANASALNIVKPSNINIKDEKVTISGLAGNNYQVRAFEVSNSSTCGLTNAVVPTLNNDCDLQLSAKTNSRCPAKMTVKINAGAATLNNACIKEFQVRVYSLSFGLQTYPVPKQAEAKLTFENLPDDEYSIALYMLNNESEKIQGCEKIVTIPIFNCNITSKQELLANADDKINSKVLNTIVWPNPANQELNIQIESGITKANIFLELIDGSGRIIKQLIKHNFNSSIIKLNTVEIANGTYFLVIKDDKGMRTVKKVAIQH